jgi:glycosyltransferase involved in cell wall biosynthesis
MSALDAPSAAARPLVSIVIACHNYGRFLGEAIESALQQTYQPVEVIVVDDGSTDDSVQVAQRYPVHVLTQPNSGICVTANRGIAASHGIFVLRLDADDRLAPTYVEETIATLTAEPDADFAYTEVEYFGAETGTYPIEKFDVETITERNYINASALMRRSAFDTVGGYDTGMRTSRYEDWDLWLRFAERGLRGVMVSRPLLQYRRHAAASRGTLDLRSTQGIKREVRLASQLQDNHPCLYAPGRILRRLRRLPGRLWRREVKWDFALLYIGFAGVMLMRSVPSLNKRSVASCRISVTRSSHEPT